MLDFEKWARREVYLEEGVMLLLDEPFDYGRVPQRIKKSFDDMYETAIRDIRAHVLHATPVRGQYLGRGQYRWWLSLSLPDLLAWAREKKYPIPQELEEAVHRFHPEPKDRPQGGAENSDLTALKQQDKTPAERYAKECENRGHLRADRRASQATGTGQPR